MYLSALHSFLGHVVITAHAGLGMRSVHLTSAHAAAYAACSGELMSLTHLCGRNAELTVLLFCKTRQVGPDIVCCVASIHWITGGCAFLLIHHLRGADGHHAACMHNTALPVDSQAVAKQLCCPDRSTALPAPLFTTLTQDMFQGFCQVVSKRITKRSFHSKLGPASWAQRTLCIWGY